MQKQKQAQEDEDKRKLAEKNEKYKFYNEMYR